MLNFFIDLTQEFDVSFDKPKSFSYWHDWSSKILNDIKKHLKKINEHQQTLKIFAYNSICLSL